MIRRAKCAISDKMRGDPLVRSRGRCGSSGLFLSAAAGADACGAQGVGALFAAGRPGRRQSVFSARFNRRELFLAACRPERWQPEFTGGSTGVARAVTKKAVRDFRGLLFGGEDEIRTRGTGSPRTSV